MNLKITSGDNARTQQIAVSLGVDLIRRLDATAAKLSRPGLDLTHTNAIRIALLTGAQAKEKEK